MHPSLPQAANASGIRLTWAARGDTAACLAASANRKADLPRCAACKITAPTCHWQCRLPEFQGTCWWLTTVRESSRHCARGPAQQHCMQGGSVARKGQRNVRMRHVELFLERCRDALGDVTVIGTSQACEISRTSDLSYMLLSHPFVTTWTTSSRRPSRLHACNPMACPPAGRAGQEAGPVVIVHSAVMESRQLLPEMTSSSALRLLARYSWQLDPPSQRAAFMTGAAAMRTIAQTTNVYTRITF